MQLLRRYADRVVLVLDGDEAGRKRTDQFLELFVAEPVDLRILTLPDELDPCDFLLARGAAAFEQLLAGATDALEHKFRAATGKLTADSGVHESNRALEEVLATLAKAARPPGDSAGGGAAQRRSGSQPPGDAVRHWPKSELRARLTSLRRRMRADSRTGGAGAGPTAIRSAAIDRRADRILRNGNCWR